MKEKIYTLKETLILNIKYYRYINNMSQEKLAEKCKLSPRYLTDVERGLHCPTIPKIECIAKALNISPYKLFMETQKDPKIMNKINNGRQYNQTIKDSIK